MAHNPDLARRDLHRFWMTLVRRGDDPTFIAALIASAVSFDPDIAPPPDPPMVAVRYTGHERPDRAASWPSIAFPGAGR